MSHASKRLATAVAAELQAIYQRRGGLNPQAVVKWAERHPASALHGRFTWDDTAAARAYRLWQARELIVTIEVEYPDRRVRQVYVSPVQGRGTTGYVALVDVLSDKRKRDLFLAQALAEYERVGEKYHDLEELAEVREAVRKVGRRGKKKAA